MKKYLLNRLIFFTWRLPRNRTICTLNQQKTTKKNSSKENEKNHTSSLRSTSNRASVQYDCTIHCFQYVRVQSMVFKTTECTAVILSTLYMRSAFTDSWLVIFFVNCNRNHTITCNIRYISCFHKKYGSSYNESV